MKRLAIRNWINPAHRAGGATDLFRSIIPTWTIKIIAHQSLHPGHRPRSVSLIGFHLSIDNLGTNPSLPSSLATLRLLGFEPG